MKKLTSKLKMLCMTMRRYGFCILYGVKFERGFEYQRIKHSDLDLLEKHHYLMIQTGWEKYTDVNAGLSSAWCWYRKGR